MLELNLVSTLWKIQRIPSSQ